MALPVTRSEHKEYCLKALGKTAIKVNVTDEQIEDRIDEGLQYYWDYHFDGTEKIYYKVAITEQMKTDRYITLPENIIGAVNIFDISSALGGNGTSMFSVTYQFALNDMWSFMNDSLVPYYMAMQHIRLLEQVLVGQQPLRYNRHRNQLFIDTDWNKFVAGQFIIVEAYQIVDPDEFPNVWKDRWLLRYNTQLIKKQWGTNLKRYSGLPLPGGITNAGQEMYNEADADLKAMEEEMINTYSLPVSDMIG